MDYLDRIQSIEKQQSDETSKKAAEFYRNKEAYWRAASTANASGLPNNVREQAAQIVYGIEHDPQCRDIVNEHKASQEAARKHEEWVKKNKGKIVRSYYGDYDITEGFQDIH